MLTIRLNRVGKRNHAAFRVVVMDHKRATDAKFVDHIGYYDPHDQKEPFHVDAEKAAYWISKGAKASTTVASFLNKMDIGVVAPVRKKKTTKPKKKDEEAKKESAEKQPDKREIEEKTEEKTEEKKEPPVEEKKAETEDAPDNKGEKEKPKNDEKKEVVVEKKAVQGSDEPSDSGREPKSEKGKDKQDR